MNESIHTSAAQAAQADQDPHLAETIARFERISSDLRSSYAALAERAEHVEQELVRTNAELERRVAELDAILEALPTGVLVRDARGSVVRANRAALELLAENEERLLGAVEIDGLPVRATEGARIELVDGEGRARTLHTRTGPIREGRGTVQILDDRTTLEQLGRRAANNEKLAAVGTLAAGIAHEIRNPLNATKGFAGLLAKNLEPETKYARWAGLAVDGCVEAEGIVTGLLHFAEPGNLELSTVDPRTLVDEVLSRCALPQDAELTLEIDAGGFPGDGIKLRQALRNLVENAIQHQPDAVRLAINVSETEDEVVISVADGGPGLDPLIVERVLEPFFTTRPEGTGLGLALCHTIVRLHGGRLETSADPSPLGGAEFRLCLPKTPFTTPLTPAARSASTDEATDR